MENNNPQTDGRRDVASRETKWANNIARSLARKNITPNQISLLSVFFAAVGCLFILLSSVCPIVSFNASLPIYIVCIQMRLLCNLFDGMVAIEGGKKSINGDLYNDIPDRFSDALFIIPIGYLAGGIDVELAWLAALLAIMTAYFRWIGVYKSGEHFFDGPMAKQHRMALLTIAALAGLVANSFGYLSVVFLVALIVMNIGLIITLIRRLYFISKTNPK